MEMTIQIINLIIIPLMFARKNFFPTSLMPEWIQTIACVNPLTYLTDPLRQLNVLPLNPSALITDFTYLGIFAAVLFRWAYCFHGNIWLGGRWAERQYAKFMGLKGLYKIQSRSALHI
jgi:ABC-type multidrug transport system permease subunit